jgi:hypothetical protein
MRYGLIVKYVDSFKGLNIVQIFIVFTKLQRRCGGSTVLWRLAWEYGKCKQSQNLNGGDKLGDLDAYGRIILELFLN